MKIALGEHVLMKPSGEIDLILIVLFTYQNVLNIKEHNFHLLFKNLKLLKTNNSLKTLVRRILNQYKMEHEDVLRILHTGDAYKRLIYLFKLTHRLITRELSGFFTVLGVPTLKV